MKKYWILYLWNPALCKIECWIFYFLPRFLPIIFMCARRKQKIQRSILQSVVFQWYKIQYFFTGTNYLRLKLFVIRTFILFLKIKMYACRTFWLSCFFIKDVDNAAYTVGKTFQRGKRPVLLWQSRLKKMSSASGYERNGV